MSDVQVLRSARASTGQTLAEFAMVVPLIVLLLLAALDMGRAVFAYNTLAQAARAGSRVAMVNQDPAAVRQKVVESAVSLGLSTSSVDVCFKTATSTQAGCGSPTVDDCPSASRSVGCLALVTARLNYTPMTPIISTIWSSIALSSTSVAPIEHVCPSAEVLTCP